MNEYYNPKFEEAIIIRKCTARKCNNQPNAQCCFFANYCSSTCQESDWSRHSHECTYEIGDAVEPEPIETFEDTELDKNNEIFEDAEETIDF